MLSFEEWAQKNELNKQGGFDPATPEQKKIFKKADLIVLPEGVEGTNCFNCEYVKGKNGNLGMCDHPEVKQVISDRMCCSFWDHEKVDRKF